MEADAGIQKMIRQILKENSLSSSYYTNPQLITNALSQSLDDEDVVVKKMSLDFMVKFIDILNRETFQREHLSALMISLFKLFTSTDLSLIKRVVKFLFKKNDFSEVSVQHMD